MTATFVPGRLRRLADRRRRVTAAARSSLFWALLSRQRRWIKWMVGLLIVAAAFGLISARLLVSMVNVGIVDQAAPLGQYLWRIAIFAALGSVFTFGAQMLIARIGYQIEFDLRTWLYTRIQWAELRKLDAVKSGQLVTRSMTDLQVLVMLLQWVPALAGLAPIIIALAVFVFILSPILALVALASLPINLYLIHRFRHRMWGLSWAELNERAEVTAAVDGPVRGIRVVKAFGREADEDGRVAAAALRAYRYSMTRVRLLARYSILIRLTPFLSQAVMLLAGAWLLQHHALSLGAFLLAFQFGVGLTQVSSALDQIASAWQYLRGAQGRLGDVLALGTRPSSEGHQLPEERTGLVLADVRIDAGNRRLIDGVSLLVGPGEIVVVTGPPGSGKTTLASVAAGMLDPSGGTIAVDGVPVGDIDPAELRQAVRIVAEEPLLFATTLRENLTMGAAPGTTDEQIARALAAAAATDIVDAVGGLHGVVGDRGLTLSGGQRQRIGVARALVVDPRVLVLDDALSAVNPSLEIEILRRIRTAYPEIAILCVTRRGGPIAIADEVLELRPPGSTAPAKAEDLAVDVGGSDAPLDPRLAAIIASLELTEESPGLDDRAVLDGTQPSWAKVLRPFRWLIVLTVGVVLVQTIAQVSPQALFGQVTDSSGTASSSKVGAIAVILPLIGVVNAVTWYYSQVLAQRFNQGLIYGLRRRVFHRLARLGIDFYDRELPGEVATRVVNDLDTLVTFLQGQGFQLLIGAMQFVVGMVIIVVLAPSVAVVVVAMLALMLVATSAQMKFGTRAFGWARAELGRVIARFEEDFEARHEIRALGARHAQTRRFVAAGWRLRRARWYSALLNTGYSSYMAFLGQLTGAVVLWRAGHAVLAGSLAVGAALSLQLLATVATQPIQNVTSYYGQLLQVRVSWARLREPFVVPILPVQRNQTFDCAPITGDLEFEQVCFSYPHTGRQVLHDVSFQVPAGSLVALVGYTGAGKSSIAKLLSRTYDPDVGAVRANGIDLRDYDVGSYRARLGIVPQDDFVFRGTVASNIAYAVPDSQRPAIELAAESVGAYETLTALPLGFDHPVEDEGRNLTAAQRQLIALARAWLAGPDVLVLDEATASLDAKLEDDVLAAIKASGRTTLMVTHRESAVQRADWVVVLDRGRVAETGRHSEVIGAGGAYDRLWVAEGTSGRRARRRPAGVSDGARQGAIADGRRGKQE